MTCNVCSVYKGLFLMCFLSSTILLTLISCNVIASNSIENSTASSVEVTDSVVSKGSVVEKDIVQPQSVEDKGQSTKGDGNNNDPIIGKEFIFSEALSQNSAMASGGLPDTGQPVLITLVDTAAAELTNSIIDQLDSEKVGNKTSESNSSFSTNPVIVNVTDVSEAAKSAEVNQSGVESKEENIIRAVPQEKEDNRAAEKLKETIAVVNETVVVSDSASITTSNDDVATKEVVTTPSPNQVQEEIPSFAEWAQKQLEEAEKNKDNTVNRSTQSTQGIGNSNSNMKVRSKNYASPDCGAKIVAANPEAGSASYILTPNKDEYMLNTCNSRIWFVVELCEAIQAKKVDLANFELFSSTPKNFSVFVSDRIPTREWASVGQFIAKDEKDVQTFNLHPHLFGKFVKVEIHSYYGAEHYCPISLFRVYGTSEFEVFETENSPHSQSSQPPDDDDDILEDMNITEKEDQSRNLFGSARDAVLSIVKKAAQVLVKSSDSKNATQMIEIQPPKSNRCKTPSHIIVCDNCSNSMFTDVFNLLSCHSEEIDQFVQTPVVRDTLCNTDICQTYGLDFKSRRTSYVTPRLSTYISTFLFPSYIAALCNMLAIIEKKVVLNTSYEAELNVTTNLTIDKKVQNAIEDGNLNELLQKPFVTCTDASNPQCNNEAEKNTITDSKQSIKITPEIVGGDLSGIRPTRTVQRDTDSKQPVITITGTVSDKTSSSEKDMKSIEQTVLDKNFVKNEPTKETSTTSSIEKIVDEKKNDSSSQENIKSEEKPSTQITGGTQGGNNSADNVEGKNGVGDIVDESNIKMSTQDQMSLDSLLKELEQASSDAGQNQISSNTMPSSQGQKESVFLRLSNRIKALERNMSLSGQYLEELSRRYKKQMEEMQKTFEKTLSAVSEEAKKAEERDQKSTEEMSQLQKQLADLSTSVSILVSERESWFGTLSLTKIIICQIIITVLVIYLIKRYTAQSSTDLPEGKISKVKNYNKSEKSRRKSSEVPASVVANEVKIKKRRPSEEALHITRAATDMRETFIKAEKKKRKRKSPIIQRSHSIAAPPEPNLGDFVDIIPKDEMEWSPLDLSKNMLNTPIALDEAEFLIPEMDPKDFHLDLDEDNVPNTVINGGGSSVKKEFPKTNGSIFGKITPESKKTDKSRRVSSPTFFKAALARSSTRSANTPLGRSVSPIEESNRMLPMGREVRSEERIVKREPDSPQLSTWSSVGDISDASGSVKTDAQSIKQKRTKRSFKNIFKKVF